MPNRIVREGIITSEPINGLNWAEEVFYRRLLSVVDDYGRYQGHPSLLRAACYPLQLNKVADSDIVKWLAATQKAGLVSVYAVEGKRYVEVVKFGQQVRAKHSKFPAMASGCVADAKQTLSERSAPAHLEVDVSEVVIEDDKPLVGLPPDGAHPGKNGHDLKQLRTDAFKVLEFLNEKAGKNYQPVKTNIDLIVARLREGGTADDMRAIIAKKCREWRGRDGMEEYLRPATLFGAKNFWQKYQGELAPK